MTVENLFTMEELVAQVAAILSDAQSSQPNARIRGLPDARTIRYYTTIGLLDRPALFRGRTALYRQRHLLQIIAIKRLQTNGLSLEEVQTKLLGASERELQKIAQIPSTSEAPQPALTPVRAPLWKLANEDEPSPQEPKRATIPVLLPALLLRDGATLLLSSNKRALSADDLAAIQEAAKPLIKKLQELGLMTNDGDSQ
jgi:DNA-binding transcriptional MerR regulator